MRRNQFYLLAGLMLTSNALAGETAVVQTSDVVMLTPASKKAGIRVLAQGDNAFLGQLTLKGGASVPLHRDQTEEYLYVLEGHGVLTIDGVEFQISPHTTIYMPANAEVSFTNSEAPFTAIQVFAGPESATKYAGWK